MGSRFGSIAILFIIAVIIGAAVFISLRLNLLGGDGDDAPPVVVSIEDGALILLGEPQNITVSIASGTPITSLRLVVDENLLAEAIPVYSADRGAYIGSLIWTPQQLGFADLRIIAVDDQGRESVRALRVEVTDDDARIAAALRLEVQGLVLNQQLIAGETVRIALRASGAQAIAGFEMIVDGELVADVPPTQGEDSAYVVSIDWTPLQIGSVEVEFRVLDAAGRSEAMTLTVTVLERGSVPGAATDEASTESQENGGRLGPEAADSADASPTDATRGDATVQIVSPEDGGNFRLTPDLSIDVELLIRNTGPLASVLLYVTPIAIDGTLGASNLIFSAADSLPADGEYRETVDGLERWLTAAGRYELQLVVFAADERRFDHRITIAVVADSSASEEDEQAEQEEVEQADQEAEAEAEAVIDLALVGARQAENDAGRINIELSNLSSAAVEQTRVHLSLIASHDGSLLTEARVTLSLDPDETANIPLDFSIERDINAMVVLESTSDDDRSNNTLQVSLRAPEDELEEEPPAEEPDPGEGDPEDGGDEDQQPQPDLAFHEVVFNSDGYALITVVNRGDAPVSTISISLLAADGSELERIDRPPGAQPLAPGGAEILVSTLAHNQPLVFVLDPEGEVAESDETNNSLTADPGQ